MNPSVLAQIEQRANLGRKLARAERLMIGDRLAYQRIMWTEEDGKIVLALTARVAELEEELKSFKRDVNTYRIGVRNFGAGFPFPGEEE